MALEIKKPKKTATHTGKAEAMEDINKEEVSRLGVDIPLSLMKSLKIRAMDEGKGRNLTTITIDALNDYLNKAEIE